MTFSPKLSLTVDPEPDLLLLDAYIQLVQGKIANERLRHLDAGQEQKLNELVEHTGALARKRYGDEQSRRVTRIGETLGRQVSCDSEALLQNVMAVVDAALNGYSQPVSGELRIMLERYCRLAGAYYIELRCKHLWRKNRYRFWRAIVDLHDTLLYHTLIGTTEAKHTAETAPDHVPHCGKETKKLVQSAFKELKNSPQSASGPVATAVALSKPHRGAEGNQE